MTTSGIGYIKLNRKIEDWCWHDHPVTFTVWIHILVNCNYEEKDWHGIKIGAGQMVTSIKKFAKQCGLTVPQIRNAIKNLQRTGEITCKSGNQFTLITVKKWTQYQAKNIANDLANDLANGDAGKTQEQSAVIEHQNKNIANGIANDLANKRMTTCQTTYQHLKNKEVKNKELNTKYIRRFVKPSLTEVMEYCQSRNNAIDAQAFLDFYESKGWLIGKTPMKDWKAAVRTWERRDNEKRSLKNDQLPDYYKKLDDGIQNHKQASNEDHEEIERMLKSMRRAS